MSVAPKLRGFFGFSLALAFYKRSTSRSPLAALETHGSSRYPSCLLIPNVVRCTDRRSFSFKSLFAPRNFLCALLVSPPFDRTLHRQITVPIFALGCMRDRSKPARSASRSPVAEEVGKLSAPNVSESTVGSCAKNPQRQLERLENSFVNSKYPNSFSLSLFPPLIQQSLCTLILTKLCENSSHGTLTLVDFRQWPR